MIILTIIAFVVIFSLLILVHEWGHFIAARKAGIKVEEFGIGLPPRAKALYTDKKGTVYSLNWVPFGGYVRLYGEDSGDPKVLKDPKSFVGKSIGRRTLVIVAGVLMNFLLAWVILTLGFSVGMKPLLVTPEDIEKAKEAGLVETEHVLYVHEVVPDSPAAKGGLKSKDVIVFVNEAPAPKSEDFGKTLRAGQNTLSILRDRKKEMVEVTPDAEGRLGVTISTEEFFDSNKVRKIQLPFYQAPLKAAQEVGRLSVLTVEMLGRVVVTLLKKFKIPEGVAGPVGIAQMTHSFVQEGFMAILQFTALISISLGVLNIMPFPALDGGRFLFILFEIVLRKRPSPRWEGAIHSIGFALLMLLILAVTWNDILNLIQ